MMSPRLQILVFAGVILLAGSTSAGFIDLFTWNLGSSLTPSTSDANRRDDGPTPITKRNCSCEGSGCNCCIDFNLSFIDLGGPGCVRMNYISPTEGILVNVSYGDSDLHSETVKGANPEPTCMNVLTDLAQVCARFSDLAPTSDGLRWCLQLEPTLLGDVQAQYQVGCFRMGPLGMTVDPPIQANLTVVAPVAGNATEGVDKPGTEEETDTSEAALIAAVNESAEEGIAFFSNLLGINFGGAEIQANQTEGQTNSTQVTTPSLATEATSSAPSAPTTETTVTPAPSTTTSTPAPAPASETREARSRFYVPGTSVNRIL